MNKVLIQTLLNLPRIGRKTAKKIIENSEVNIGSLDELYELLTDLKNRNFKVLMFKREKLLEAHDKALEMFYNCDSLGITILSESDCYYPKRLLTITDKPLLLFVKGNLDALNSECSVAVIGSRKPSKYGIRAGSELTKHLVERRVTIVSGLAQGCDTIAHEVTLQNNGITIAVLPCGLDTVYPKSNSKLLEDILNSNGTIISEYPLKSRIQKSNFIERDRLQSGLSDAVFIIEADINSGTMHTYEYATKQKRLVGVLDHPNEAHTEQTKGNAHIIETNAGFPLASKEDIHHFVRRLKRCS